jgi:ubiquitin carboxyl-terminal hydrolase 2/21
MNSVIQCLSHTRELTKYIRALPTTPRGTAKEHRVLVEYTKLMNDMWNPSNKTVNPTDFKFAFSSKHRMYSGTAQQDSQEFLRYFLDTLHSSLNESSKPAPVKLDDSLSNSEKSDLMWEWYSKVENSMIKDLFVGQLRSTLKCTVCGNESLTFDPFWDLRCVFMRHLEKWYLRLLI